MTRAHGRSEKITPITSGEFEYHGDSNSEALYRKGERHIKSNRPKLFRSTIGEADASVIITRSISDVFLLPIYIVVSYAGHDRWIAWTDSRASHGYRGVEIMDLSFISTARES